MTALQRIGSGVGAAVSPARRAATSLRPLGSALDPLLVPRLLAGALADIRSIAASTAALTAVVDQLAAIEHKVDSLDDEVRRMRESIGSIGSSVEPLEREIAGVRASVEPLRSTAERLGRLSVRRRRSPQAPVDT